MATKSPESHPDVVAKRLSIPEADHLAELAILRDDLNNALECFDLYFTKYWADHPTEEDYLVANSLFRDGIMLFCSCFSRSEKEHVKPSPEDVYGHLEEWTDYYQYIHGLRDGFVGHNFGPYRQNNIGVECSVIDGKLYPVQITGRKASLGGFNLQERPQLLGFVAIAYMYVSKRMDEAREALWPKVQKLTPEELAELPNLTVALPNPTDVKVQRRKFRKNEKGRRTLDVPDRRFRITETG